MNNTKAAYEAAVKAARTRHLAECERARSYYLAICDEVMRELEEVYAGRDPEGRESAIRFCEDRLEESYHEFLAAQKAADEVLKRDLKSLKAAFGIE